MRTVKRLSLFTLLWLTCLPVFAQFKILDYTNQFSLTSTDYFLFQRGTNYYRAPLSLLTVSSTNGVVWTSFTINGTNANSYVPGSIYAGTNILAQGFVVTNGTTGALGFVGLLASGNVTNAAGSRVVYLSDISSFQTPWLQTENANLNSLTNLYSLLVGTNATGGLLVVDNYGNLSQYSTNANWMWALYDVNTNPVVLLTRSNGVVLAISAKVNLTGGLTASGPGPSIIYGDNFRTNATVSATAYDLISSNNLGFVKAQGGNFVASAGISAALGSGVTNAWITVSNNIAYPSSAGIPINAAHGFGNTPSAIALYFVCTNADQGYAIGDELPANYVFAASTTYSPALSVGKNATNYWLTCQSITPFTLNKTTGAKQGLTVANWNLRIYAMP